MEREDDWDSFDNDDGWNCPMRSSVVDTSIDDWDGFNIPVEPYDQEKGEW